MTVTYKLLFSGPSIGVRVVCELQYGMPTTILLSWSMFLVTAPGPAGKDKTGAGVLSPAASSSSSTALQYSTG